MQFDIRSFNTINSECKFVAKMWFSHRTAHILGVALEAGAAAAPDAVELRLLPHEVEPLLHPRMSDARL